MIRRFDLKVIVLTLAVTIGVIGFWEVALRPPFFALVDAYYPGDANAQLRWNIEQRFEHFFISFLVDAMVVTMLLRLVHKQQRQLRESEARYRALFEQARDGIGVVRRSDRHLVEANNKVCEILGVQQDNCIDRDIHDLIHTSTPPEFNGPTAGESELTIQTAQGKPLPVALSFTPLATDGEDLMIMSLRDLSLRKKLEAEREEMQRQL